MSLTRRSFFRTAGAAGVGLMSGRMIAARGREAYAATQAAPARTASKLIRISSNENAYGPGPAALAAARDMLGPGAGRYPENYGTLAAAIARHFNVRPENVLIGTGSTEVIKGAVLAFTSPTRHL